MKMNKVILGLAAAAMGLASANVMAQTTLADYNANPAGFLNVFASGASAQDQGIERWFRLQCTNNSLHIYRITGNGNQRLFLCNVTSATVPGFPAGGQRVAFFKSSVGGSGNGVQPVADQTLLAFLDPANVSGCNSPAATAAAPPFGAFFDHTCTTSGTLQNRVSDAGISDVEPRLFGATPAQVQRLTVSSQNAVIWGVPVTTALRNAIQDAQSSVVTGNRESLESMPALSRQQVTSLYVGQLNDWNDFTHPGSGVGVT